MGVEMAGPGRRDAVRGGCYGGASASGVGAAIAVIGGGIADGATGRA
jgi:hypothetical protein